MKKKVLKINLISGTNLLKNKNELEV